jgi:hypothetical protein
MPKSRRPRMPDAPVDLDFSAIVEGSVVTHEDQANTHYAIVIVVTLDGFADILMFSSKQLGYRCRAVTKEELALSGFISSKKTFLSLKRRPLWELRPRGLEFPSHRVEKLKQEFLSVGEPILDLVNHRANCFNQ